MQFSELDGFSVKPQSSKQSAGESTETAEESIDWYHYCQRSTWHGISDIYAARSRAVRCFWTVLLLAATGAAIYGCYSILKQYQESPLYVSYIVRDARQRQIPDVVVCPFNRFDKNALLRYNISNDLAEFMELAYGMSTPYKFNKFSPMNYLRNNSYELALQDFLARSNMTFRELVNNASITCTSLIKYCYSPTMKGYFNCCDNSGTIISGVGKCFRLRGTTQISSGYGFGLTIVIDTPTEIYSSSSSNLHNEGVSIKLAEPGKGVSYDITFLPTGAHALMPLRATLYEFIDLPPRYECMETTNNPYYSPQTCFDECVFSSAESECNCSHIATIDDKYPACTPKGLYHCLYSETAKAAKRHAQERNGGSLFNYCRKKCKPPCMYWDYYPTVSYADFPTAELRHYVNDMSDIERYIILDVFYERLEYTLIQHLPSMTIPQFISNLGGQLGLWVGGSILTIAQLVIFICQYTYLKTINKSNNACRKAKNQAKTPQNGLSRHVENRYRNTQEPKATPASEYSPFFFRKRDSNGENQNFL